MGASDGRGIIFSAPMVLAILSGTKTQTRRVLRLTDEARAWFEKWGECVGPPVHEAPGHYRWPSPVSISFAHDGRPGGNTAQNAFSPYGAPGDRLWVRETWSVFSIDAYKYGGQDFGWTWNDNPPTTWRPSLHMPRWASRITLEVTEVRVQRLQDISEEDARAEGVEPHHDDPRLDFRALWDSINRDRAPWSANPWVWCISFRRLP